MAKRGPRIDRQRLKTIDMEIVRAAIVLSSLLDDRYKIDAAETELLTDGIVETLRRNQVGKKEEKV